MNNIDGKGRMQCVLCDEIERRVLIPEAYFFEQSFSLVRCKSCGLMSVDPMPSDGQITRMYGESYFQDDWSLGFYGGAENEDPEKRREELLVLKTLETLNGSHGKLLEVGAAGGCFLSRAREYGWEAEGIEISEWGVRTAKEKFGLDLKKGDLFSVSLPPSRYDAIFLGDVFEHLTRPAEALTVLRTALKPGGVLALLLPMYMSSWIFSLILRVSGLLAALHVPEEILAMLKVRCSRASALPPYHVYEYSPATIAALLKKNGFADISVRGSLPVPAFFRGGADNRNWLRKTALSGLGFAYRIVKASSEQINFPIVRSLVTARKESLGEEKI